MARKRNTWLWVGGAVLAWYLLRKKIGKRSTAIVRPGPAPRRNVAPRAEVAAENAVTSMSFVPDMPTDAEIYKASQKFCK